MCFFFNNTPPTEIYTLSLHDALPISGSSRAWPRASPIASAISTPSGRSPVMWCALHRLAKPRISARISARSEEHTSELQSRQYLVCRLLLEKKNKHYYYSFSVSHFFT